jgi:endonuclease/exonuclease/phosphatase family metal-dependent hydrolase
MRKYLATAAVASLVLAACDATAPTDATPVASDNTAVEFTDLHAISFHDDMERHGGRGAMPIRVFQHNVGPGFNIDNVVTGLVLAGIYQNPQIFIDSLVVGLSTFQSTNWRERAARIAAEVRRLNPDVVTLQEMVTISNQGLELIGLPFPDQTTDFLPILQEEFERLNLRYDLVQSLPLTDAVIPLAPGIFVRYIDRDVMFVRHQASAANVVAQVYAVGLDIGVAGVPEQVRGFIAADVTVRGKTWRVVGTHPEPSWPALGETPQITELVNAVANETRPVIIAGDLNLEPGSPEYAQLAAAGFADLYLERQGRALDGLTCCHSDPGLRNPEPDFTKRIDYVLARPGQGMRLGPVLLEWFGDDQRERTATGLWPSDHAGIETGLVMLPARGGRN